MVYTVGCNFRCPYCHNPELVDESVEKIWTEKQVLDFLKNRKHLLEGLVVTGGEPTIHDDLPNFIKKVKKLGFLVKLDSNGTNPQMLKQLVNAGLIDYVAMDIKSPLSRYSQVVCHPVNTKDIKKSISFLLKSKVPYEFRTTLVKSLVSPEDVEKIGRTINGAEKYFLQKFIPTKILNPQFLRKATYSDEELKILQTKLKKYVKHCAIR